jgi:hypothetical protein
MNYYICSVREKRVVTEHHFPAEEELRRLYNSVLNFVFVCVTEWEAVGL